MEDIKIALNQLLNVKKVIYNDSFWCFKDILEGIVDIDVEDDFKGSIVEVETYIQIVSNSLEGESSSDINTISNFFSLNENEKVKLYLEEFTQQLKISKKIFNLFLDKLEVIIENSNGDYSKSDEAVLTTMIEMAENISKYCHEDGESAKELLEEITSFNKKYEEII